GGGETQAVKTVCRTQRVVRAKEDRYRVLGNGDVARGFVIGMREVVLHRQLDATLQEGQNTREHGLSHEGSRAGAELRAGNAAYARGWGGLAVGVKPRLWTDGVRHIDGDSLDAGAERLGPFLNSRVVAKRRGVRVDVERAFPCVGIVLVSVVV